METTLSGVGLIGLTRCGATWTPQDHCITDSCSSCFFGQYLTQQQERPVNRWSLDEIATALLETLATNPISRSSIWRILQDIDLKPHKSEYWLDSHDEDFDMKAQTICQLYARALESFEKGRLVICCDEKSGMQVLDRKAPTKPARPGACERTRTRVYSPRHTCAHQLFGGGHRRD